MTSSLTAHLATFAFHAPSLPECCTSYVNAVIGSEDLKAFKKASRSLPDHDGPESQLAFDFLEDVFRAAYEAYSTHQDTRDGESTFNDLFIYRFLVAVCKALKDHSCQADFKRDEANLVAMSKQLIALGLEVDNKSQYKADGLIKFYGLNQLEALLLETSGSLNNTDKVKINFDHHKAIFGSLAMLKTVADEFPHASIKTFKDLKVYFVHAAGTKVHLWSIRFRPQETYELWRESSLEIMPSFEDRLKFLPALIQFFWSIKGLLDKSVEVIVALRDEHEKIQAESRRFASPPRLTDIVNPIILRLSQEEDSAGVSKLGPFYSPPHD